MEILIGRISAQVGMTIGRTVQTVLRSLETTIGLALLPAAHISKSLIRVAQRYC